MWTSLIARGKKGLKWADVPDYITVSSDKSFVTLRYKRSPSSRIYKTICLKMLIPLQKKEQSHKERRRNGFLFKCSVGNYCECFVIRTINAYRVTIWLTTAVLRCLGSLDLVWTVTEIPSCLTIWGYGFILESVRVEPLEGSMK